MFKKKCYLLIIPFFLLASLSEARLRVFFNRSKLIHKKPEKKAFKTQLLAGLLSLSLPAEAVHLLSLKAQHSILNLSQLKKDKSHQKISEFYQLDRHQINMFNFYTHKYGVGNFALFSILEEGKLDVLDFYFKSFHLSSSLKFYPEEISLLHLALFLGKKDISLYLIENGAFLEQDSNAYKLKPLDMLFLDKYPLQTDQKLIYHFEAKDLNHKKSLKEFFKEKYPKLYVLSEKKMKNFEISN